MKTLDIVFRDRTRGADMHRLKSVISTGAIVSAYLCLAVMVGFCWLACYQ